MAVITICSDFGAQKDKVSHCFHCFPSVCHEVMGPDDYPLQYSFLENPLDRILVGDIVHGSQRVKQN